ncbi:MAG TPA: DUF1571 domain-containing protein [Bacteroidia bacterium]|nr:DUF1571 domain-containing protein [Bacteroidia bacterium]
MKLLIKRFSIISILFFLIVSMLKPNPVSKTRYSETISAIQILQQMVDSIENIKTLKVKLVALERFQSKYLKSTSYFKISYYPQKKLYFNNPEKKLQILYIEGQNDNKALVKHPSLPISIFLDPNGAMMKKNQHYTIHELGFEYIAKTIQIALSKEKEKYLNYLHYLGIHEKNNKQCYTLMYESSNFDYEPYIVQHKETIASIAKKLNINEYIIRDINNLYNEFGFLKKNSTILVPKMYCKKAFLYIDTKTFLPVSINLYDNKGLLESYDYFDVQKNIVFKEQEFSKHYKDYNF